MAVEDKYILPYASGLYSSTRPEKTLHAHGAESFWLYNTFEVAAADDNGSKYRVFKNLDANLIPIIIAVGNDAITAGTGYDVGLYRPNGGAALDDDCFAATLDMSVAAASMNPKTAKDGMAAVAIENYGRRLFEHAGHTISNKLNAYDLVLTADTVGTAAGTISVAMLCVQG